MNDVPVGSFQPCTSRYKCMFMFLRPGYTQLDQAGNPYIVQSAGKTNCALPIGHPGPHMNTRGETSAGTKGDFGKMMSFLKVEMAKAAELIAEREKSEIQRLQDQIKAFEKENAARALLSREAIDKIGLAKPAGT